MGLRMTKQYKLHVCKYFRLQIKYMYYLASSLSSNDNGCKIVFVLSVVLDLVRKGVDVTRADTKGRTALHFASCRGDANMGKLCAQQIRSPFCSLKVKSITYFF